MKLVNRVSVFFLAALAVVLVVYSGIFYAVLRGRLVQQFEQELHGALNSLVAAVEVEPEEVKWQPLEHTIGLGDSSASDPAYWVVIGDRTQVVERSGSATAEFVEQAQSLAADAARNGTNTATITQGEWKYLLRRLVALRPDRSQRELDEFDEVVVVVARSTAPLTATLNRLLLFISVLPLAVWLVAAAVGHGFCRRALQPVLDMAARARSMTGDDLHARLPVTETRDELADLATAFNTLLDRQQHAFEQQRRFAGNAAHELRTPLTILLGQMDVALRRLRTPEEYDATLRMLRDESAQLQKIVESLLFLARADEDAILPDMETFDLGAWLPGYLHRWESHPRYADIRVHAEPTQVFPIRASTALLARLLDNLLENAFKYSPPGSPVELTLSRIAAEAVVEVQDYGTGIAAEDLPVIFEPFYRARSVRDAGIAGAGLGLTLAARIAAAFGGQLDCTSQRGHGTRFTVRLPLTECPCPSGQPAG